MKKLFVSLLTLATFAAHSTDCIKMPQAPETKLPIQDINAFNNTPGDKRITGNGAVPKNATFNGWGDLEFNGNQVIQAPINMVPGSCLFIHNTVVFDRVSMPGGANIWVAASATLRIKDFVPNNDYNRIILQDGTGKVWIDGKEYKNGDVYRKDNVCVYVSMCSGSLPVTFGSVDAITHQDNIVVVWQTLTESNNKVFYVEGSKDGETWQWIGEVKSQAVNGNSDQLLTYKFTGSAVPAEVITLFMPLLALLLPFRRRLYRGLAVIITVGAIACSKGKSVEVEQSPDRAGNVKFIRIKQVDIDQNFAVSKVVKTRHYE